MKIFHFILFLFFPILCFAASSVHAPLESSTYHYLNLLESHGLISSMIHGHKPYSRVEVARLLLEAKKNLEIYDDKESLKWAKKVLASLEKEYVDAIVDFKRGKGVDQGSRLDFTYLDSASVLFTYLDSNVKTFPVNNGTGSIQATSNPFVQNRGGRHYVDGPQYAFETKHWAHVSPYVSFYFQPRFQFQFPTGNQNDEDQAFVQELYAAGSLYNLSLKIGRSSLILGQGPEGGLILSNNARPRDQIVFGSEHPFKFPWFFKHLGYQKVTTFFGTLGPESFFPETILAGYKWTIKPFKVWEIGLSNAMQIGGEGAPDFSVLDFVGDFVGFSGTASGTSNRILGFDTRIMLPFLRNTQFFGEMFLDDKTVTSFRRTFVDTVAYYGGVSIPCLNSTGTLQALAEFRYISELFYRHGQFRHGFTLNNTILGDYLGPDGRSLHASLRWDKSLDSWFAGHFFYERSDSNTYNLTGTFSNVTVNGPAEERLRGLGEVHHRFNRFIQMIGRVGYERVSNFNYVLGDDRNNYLVEMGVEFDLKGIL